MNENSILYQLEPGVWVCGVCESLMTNTTLTEL